MTSDEEITLLRAVQFVAGKSSGLFFGRSPYSQLDAVAEVLDFANSYVLNDTIAVSGLSFRLSNNGFAEFVAREAESSDSVEMIGNGSKYTFDITPFDECLGIPDYENRLNNLDRSRDEYARTLKSPHDPTALEEEMIRNIEAKYDQLADEARVLQQRSYILLADRLRATYVPERLYGKKALESYTTSLPQVVHSTEEEFRKRLASELESLASPNDLEVHVPSFFVEALRQSETMDGIWRALRDLRYSKAAETYRSLARIVVDDSRSLNERRNARQELKGRADAVFTGDSLKSRIPRSVKFVVGMSSALVGVLIPATAIFAASAPVMIEALDGVDQWFRKRANMFEIYKQIEETDLFAELKRLFPTISFGPDHLAYFLKERNFGWPKVLDQDLYSRWR
jgi:hypothetical protein